ncbi:MAG: EAL and GGDEF domain-containing protein [Syntrophaceae bacterium]|nr:EAL and GGDEF domain-containing protein [Syntrophaceae bacterium]
MEPVVRTRRRFRRGNSLESPEESSIDVFVDHVDPRPHFHPILDLLTGTVLGYEVLSRGNPPFVSPCAMFGEAGKRGCTWEMERACRVAALKKITSLPDGFRTAIYFINVSPDIFSDPRFLERFTQTRLGEYGLDQGQIVLEITEEKAFADVEHFSSLIRHYVNQGFRISLDDFGSGYSGLISLVASTPHYLKLDMAIVRDVHLHEYKQKLLKSIASIATSVNAKLIAEGVESWEELDVLLKYGVRYAQGFLFGRPMADPYLPAEEMKRKIASLVKRYDSAKVELDEVIGSLAIRPMTIAQRTVDCRAMDDLFKNSLHLDHLVILDGEEISGLVTRQHFYTQTGGAFGYQLFQKKPIDAVCKRNPLVVEDRITVTTLAKLAMDRFQEDLYDPVLVVDRNRRFLGSVTMKQIITKAVELEVRCAMGANPLTNLPGNELIRNWIHDALLLHAYSILYADLDNFKGFNDVYGFLMGDEMLRLTAKVLSEVLPSLPAGSRLGHIGGDDFVIVCPGIVEDGAVQSLCEAFDREKIALFRDDHIRQGYMDIRDRQGDSVRVPLVTISIAIVDSRRVWVDPHPALFSVVAASLKKKVKQMTRETGRSGFLFEQRTYGGSDSLHFEGYGGSEAG